MSKNSNLKPFDPSIQQKINQLIAENRKLQKHVVKLQIQGLSANNRIAALEAELKKRPNLLEILNEAHKKRRECESRKDRV